MSRIDELVAALGDHEVTDSAGEVKEETETSEEDSTPPEPNEEEAPVEEAAEESPTEEVKEEADEVEDESGKKYIPIERFNKVYGKMKAAERKATEKEADLSSIEYPENKESAPTPERNWDKADVLEVKLAYPQFDPKPDAEGEPTNSEYSRELDELAFSYLQADPKITPMQAAQKSLKTFEKLTRKEVEVRTKAKKVKLSASETPLSGRNRSKGSGEPDPGKMSFKEMESYLRETGYFG